MPRGIVGREFVSLLFTRVLRVGGEEMRETAGVAVVVDRVGVDAEEVRGVCVAWAMLVTWAMLWVTWLVSWVTLVMSWVTPSMSWVTWLMSRVSVPSPKSEIAAELILDDSCGGDEG